MPINATCLNTCVNNLLNAITAAKLKLATAIAAATTDAQRIDAYETFMEDLDKAQAEFDACKAPCGTP